jgi:hypothetical protein
VGGAVAHVIDDGARDRVAMMITDELIEWPYSHVMHELPVARYTTAIVIDRDVGVLTEIRQNLRCSQKCLKEQGLLGYKKAIRRIYTSLSTAFLCLLLCHEQHYCVP